MASMGYNNRWVRLLKDLVFVAIGFFLVWRGGFFATMLGVFALLIGPQSIGRWRKNHHFHRRQGGRFRKGVKSLDTEGDR